MANNSGVAFSLLFSICECFAIMACLLKSPIINLRQLYVDMATIYPIELTTDVAFPIIHMEFDHSWRTDVRNRLLQNLNG